MATYNFKSTGTLKEDDDLNVITTSKIPIGILTPLRVGKQTLFEMSYSLLDQLKNNLENLLLTNWGERVVLYNYGANLRPLLTEFGTQDDFDAQAIERIKNAVNAWMPFISLETYISQIVKNKIVLSITYEIPSLKSGKLGLQVELLLV